MRRTTHNAAFTVRRDTCLHHVRRGGGPRTLARVDLAKRSQFGMDMGVLFSGLVSTISMWAS